jgi:hypothetical protein
LFLLFQSVGCVESTRGHGGGEVLGIVGDYGWGLHTFVLVEWMNEIGVVRWRKRKKNAVGFLVRWMIQVDEREEK